VWHTPSLLITAVPRTFGAGTPSSCFCLRGGRVILLPDFVEQRPTSAGNRKLSDRPPLPLVRPVLFSRVQCPSERHLSVGIHTRCPLRVVGKIPNAFKALFLPFPLPQRPFLKMSPSRFLLNVKAFIELQFAPPRSSRASLPHLVFLDAKIFPYG